MANKWGSNPMVLDTAADDTTYDSTHDVRFGGSEYSTFPYKIKKIIPVGGANTNAILVKTSSHGTLKGDIIWNTTLETGDLNQSLDLGEGQVFNGIYVETLGGSTKLLVYLA
jgi:hypothetical protein